MLNNNILYPLRSDQLLIWILRGSAAIAGVIVIFIGIFLFLEAFPVLSSIGLSRFFTDTSWHPASGLYNLLPMLWGTLLATAGAIFLAAPIGILSGIYCHFYAGKRAVWSYRRLVELLAGIPSVVYGFWGLTVLVPWVGGFHPPGASLLSGILVLSIMILPTMAMAADAAFASAQTAHLQGAASLGYSRWTTISKVIFPSVQSSLFTGLILQTGRAIGETMAILMVCGNVVQTPQSLFDPIRTLTANIALEMAYATGDHRSALFVSSLVLVFIIVALVLVAEFLRHRRKYV